MTPGASGVGASAAQPKPPKQEGEEEEAAVGTPAVQDAPLGGSAPVSTTAAVTPAPAVTPAVDDGSVIPLSPFLETPLRTPGEALEAAVQRSPSMEAREAAEAEARRLRWEEVMHHEISANGQVLTGVKDPNSIGIMIWANGPLLPVTGISTWAIKLELGFAKNLRVGLAHKNVLPQV